MKINEKQLAQVNDRINALFLFPKKATCAMLTRWD